MSDLHAVVLLTQMALILARHQVTTGQVVQHVVQPILSLALQDLSRAVHLQEVQRLVIEV